MVVVSRSSLAWSYLTCCSFKETSLKISLNTLTGRKKARKGKRETLFFMIIVVRVGLEREKNSKFLTAAVVWQHLSELVVTRKPC